jgi:hypothetical protein
LTALAEHAGNLPRYENAVTANVEQRRIAELTAHLDRGDIAEVSRACVNGECEPLDEWLGDFATSFSALSDELTHHYFSLTVARLS